MERQDAPGTRDLVKMGLSESRTTVLGAQILLGFQYEALFQPRFAALSAVRQASGLAALFLLLVAIVLMIAPAAFHQIAEQDRSTARQSAVTRQTMLLSLAPFAVGVAFSLFVALGDELGASGAVVWGGLTALAAVALWYGSCLMAVGPKPSPPSAEDVPLKDRVSDIMTETRIVLPGVQALLGFQLAAYLTEAFAKLPPATRAAHDVGLGLLLLSMMLLMSPAPFHRLAEHGRDTERVVRVGGGLIIAGLAALACALCADVFVAVAVVARNTSAAIAGAVAAAAAILVVWFGWPLAARRSPSAHAGTEPQAVRHA
jgi:hypothetical protein